MCWRRLGFLAAVAVGLQSAPARADENWAFVRLSCSPTLRHFEASRINVQNLPYGAELLDKNGAPRPSAFEALAKTEGIFEVSTLAAHPFACDTVAKSHDLRGSGPWPSFTIDVRKEPELWAARISVNGVAVGTIDLAKEQAWSGVHYISVDANGVGIWVRACTEGEDARCHAGYLKDMQIPR